MDDNFEYLHNLLRHVWKLKDSFDSLQELIDELEVYSKAGWPFGRAADAFLLWLEFGQETTVN